MPALPFARDCRHPADFGTGILGREVASCAVCADRSLLIDNLGLWAPSMQSLALVLTASVLAVLIGVPIGILCAQRAAARNVVTPILDFMQTMPAFVYLLPAVSFSRWASFRASSHRSYSRFRRRSA